MQANYNITNSSMSASFFRVAFDVRFIGFSFPDSEMEIFSIIGAPSQQCKPLKRTIFVVEYLYKKYQQWHYYWPARLHIV